MGEGSQTLMAKGDFFTNKMIANAKYANWQEFWLEVEARRKRDLSSYYFNKSTVNDLIEMVINGDDQLKKIVKNNYDKFFNNFLTDLKTADFETEFFLRPLFSFQTDQLLKDFNNYYFFKFQFALKIATEEELNQQLFDFENQLRKVTNQKIKNQARNSYLDALVKVALLEGIVFKGIGLNGPDFLFEKIAYRENEQISLFENKKDQLRLKFQEIFLKKLAAKGNIPGGLDSLGFIQSYKETLFLIIDDYFKSAANQKEIIDLLKNLNLDSNAIDLKKELIDLIENSSKSFAFEQVVYTLSKYLADPDLVDNHDQNALKAAINQLP